VCTYGLVQVFGNIIGPVTGQVHKLLMCSWSVMFPFTWFSGGCVFYSCWLRFDVALCFRGLSPCVLIDFPGLGAVGFVCSGGRLYLDVAFTSGGGECLHILVEPTHIAHQIKTPIHTYRKYI
jgi:hypothetical protein